MGKIFKTPKADTSAQDAALAEAERQRELARTEQATAEAREARLLEADARRKENVKKSGRAASILAGENSNSLLGR